MTVSIIDYAFLYFKYKTPTLINREPINKALKRLKLELKVNASLVETDLRGGNYGYLGLVLTEQEYTNIPNTQLFIAPYYLGSLVILPTAIPIEVL